MKMRIAFVVLIALAIAIGMPVFAGGQGEEGQEKVSMTVWLGTAAHVPICEAAIPEFQKKYPTAEVEVVAFPLREMEKKIALGLTGGTAPDAYMLSPSFNLQHLQNGYGSPAPADVQSFVRDKFYPVYAQAVNYEEEVYGVPFFYGHLLLFWNKDHFSEAGIAGPPKTWPEMIENARKLAKYGSDDTLVRSGISLRLSDDSGAADKFHVFLHQAGGDIYIPTSGGKYRNAYDNEAGRETLKLYVDLLWKDKVNSPSIQSDFMAFAEGTASMFERGPFVVNHMAAKAPDINYGVADLPRHKKEGSIGYTHALWVPSTTKNKRAAWDFIVAVMGLTSMEMMLRDTGWPPCRGDLDLSGVYKDFPEYEKFAETAARPGYVYMAPAIGPMDEISTKFAQKLSRAWLNPKMADNPEAIDKVIADAAAETDEILKREGLYGD